MKAIFASVFCLLSSAAQAETSADALFPFVLPWDDASPSVMNLSGWLPKPAGKFGQVRAGADGHLYAGDARIRFFGVDLSFSANVPKHGDAEKVAARLAKFGVNIVRFHIMDMRRYPEGILSRNSASTQELDPEALDRLDYFIDQLNRNGIYVNLCLLNYRPLCAADGLPPEIEQAGGGPYQRRHVVGFFDEAVLETQRVYARNLLTHRNVYTGKTYAESPAVAFVEINNENGLVHAWLGREVDELPERFREELKAQWNRWLLARYTSADKVRQAWSVGEQPLGAEALDNGAFTRGLEGWTVERHEGAAVVAEPSDDAPSALVGGRSVRITVSKPGTQDWHIRFEHAGVRVLAGRACTLSFWAKADKPGKFRASIEQTHAPWHTLGGGTGFELTPQWQRYETTWIGGEDDACARVIFDPPAKAGTYALAAVSLRPGGVLGLGADERPENGGVPAWTTAQFAKRTADAQRDWLRFLWETEDRYWQTMLTYLKQDLHVQALIIGTIVGCSTPNLMAKLDAVDSHAYWQHPVFPGRPWDENNWTVKNVSMVNDRGGIFSALALRRVAGKPFCVTEYGHPAPNTFVSEGHLLRAAYAALQDWDYVSASRYSHSDTWDMRSIRNFFDIHQHPTMMATLIPAAALFLRGDVMPARDAVEVALNKEQEIDALRHTYAWKLVDAGDLGVSRETPLAHRVAIATEGHAPSAQALKPEAATGDRFVSDTAELCWDVSEKECGTVTVNAARSKAVIGFGGGKRFELGGVVIEPGPTRQAGWSAITVTAMEGEFGKRPCRMLVTATGEAGNTRMGWKNAEHSTVGKDWGEAPTVVEGIPAKITLPFEAKSVAVWALDERGQRCTKLEVVADAGGRAIIAIGPAQRTIWYEAEAK
jgi:hypothetical protein